MGSGFDWADVPWDQLVEEIQLLSWDSPWWSKLEDLLLKLEQAVSRRRAYIEKVRIECEDTFKSWVERWRELLTFFETRLSGPDTALWDANQVIRFSGRLEHLTGLFEAYSRLLAKKPETLTELRDLRERQRSLEGEILAGLSELKELLVTPKRDGAAVTFSSGQAALAPSVAEKVSAEVGERLGDVGVVHAGSTRSSDSQEADIHTGVSHSEVQESPSALPSECLASAPDEEGEKVSQGEIQSDGIAPKTEFKNGGGVSGLSDIDSGGEDDLAAENQRSVPLLGVAEDARQEPSTEDHESVVAAVGLPQIAWEIEVDGTTGIDLESPKEGQPESENRAEIAEKPLREFRRTARAQEEPSPDVILLHENGLAYGAEWVLGRQANWQKVGWWLCWRLLQERRYSLAYHFARALEVRVGRDGSDFLSHSLVEANALAEVIRVTRGDVGVWLSDTFSRLLSDKPAVNGDVFLRWWLLALAAAFRPALVDPLCGADSLLENFEPPSGFSSLYEFARILLNFSKRNRSLNFANFLQAQNLQSWENEWGKLRQELEEWRRTAPKRGFSFAPAAKIWQRVLLSENEIGRLLELISTSDIGNVEEVERRSEELGDSRYRERLIEKYHAEVRVRRGDKIMGDARKQLERAFSEVEGFARRWVALVRSNPREEGPSIVGLIQNLRDSLTGQWPRVKNELEPLLKDRNLFTRIAAGRCLGSLQDLLRFLRHGDSALAEPRPEWVLAEEILLTGRVALDDSWSPSAGYGEELIDAICEYLTKESPDWEQAYECYARRHDHASTDKIVTLLQWKRAPDEARRIQERRAEDLRVARSLARQKLAKAVAAVEEGVANGFFSEEERAEWQARLHQLESEIEAKVDFEEFDEPVRKLYSEIEGRRKQAEAQVYSRLEELGLGNRSETRLRIERCLQNGDFAAAFEYLELLATGQQLPGEEQVSSALEEYLAHWQDIYRLLQQPAGGDLICQYVRSGTPVGKLSTECLSEDQREQNVLLHRAWFCLKLEKSQRTELLRRILAELGFRVEELRPVRADPDVAEYRLRTAPIQNRELCPIREFGSEAGGNYYLVCLWQTSPEDYLFAIDRNPDKPPQAPYLVLAFRALTIEERNRIAALCRDRAIRALVVDDTLISYLVLSACTRSRAFFQCTLPFTCAEPFVVTAGVVPPEMFYGRRRAIQAILDPRGTCFIYGGRQLGKTAILREVERQFHNPGRGQIALWIDLKTEGIATARAITDVFVILATALKRFGVIPEKSPPSMTPERVLEIIEQWLNASPGGERRILLLLDEADKFLESDSSPTEGEPYRCVGLLKGLMDRTDRRFKVVFAGLHNVLRMSRQANQPLAAGHMGDPVCVGPLFADQEWKEAAALLEKPLMALGYRFESRDLAMRILAHTNYYPNLIQLYGAQVLRHLRQRPARPVPGFAGPPYLITAEDVEAVTRSEELRHHVRDRFNLTLNLDRRYRVVALIVALYSDPAFQNPPEEHFSTRRLRELARDFWEQGFRTLQTEDTFAVLLDEMVGLGVLRKTDTSQYALRNPNLRTLLGTWDQIAAQLQECRTWPADTEYHAMFFRPAFHDVGGRPDPARRSPLTVDQESRLRQRKYGVSIIFGTRAVGLDELNEYLLSSCGREFFYDWSHVGKYAEFEEQLGALQRREANGTTLAVLPWTSPWTAKWISTALERIRRARSSTGFYRLIFLADPRKTWELIRSSWETLEDQRAKGVEWMSLMPWDSTMLDHWLDDTGFGDEARNNCQTIFELTGGWPLVVKMFYKLWQERLSRLDQRLDELLIEFEEVLSRRETVQELRVAFGVDHEDVAPVLRDWAQVSDNPQDSGSALSVDDLESLTGASRETIERILRWADRLQIASYYQGGWRLNPLVAKICAWQAD